MENRLQLSPVQGVPYFDLWVLVAIVLGAVAWFYFRSSVQGVPVWVTWIFRNGSAIKLKAKEDLSGVFLTILDWRNKPTETIKKEGLALEVKKIDFDLKRAYLIDFKDNPGEAKIFLEVASSRMKHTREYTVIEGTGKTIDYLSKAKALESEKGGVDTGNAVVLHEERSAAKEFFKDFAAALAGTFRALILPLLAGGGIGVSVTLLLIILLGHFR